MTPRSRLVVTIVLVPLLVYPLVSVSGGAPRFPTRGECVRAPVEGRPIALVWGRYGDPATAEAARARVIKVGVVGTEVLPDGCGLWKVELDGVPSLEVAHEIQREADTVDLHPTLELDSDG